MSHDFARSQRIRKESPQRSSKSKKRSGIPSWLWLLVGTLAGCLIMFLVYLSGVRPPLPSPAATAPQTVAPVGSTVTTEQTPAPPKRVSPVFEFYTKLPEGGQPVTDVPPAAQPATATTPVPLPQQSVAPVADAAQPLPTTAATATAVSAMPEEDLDPMQQLLAQKEKEQKEKAQAQAAQPQPTSSKPEATSAPKAAVSGARYLQAGVFRNKAEAEKLRSRISRLGVSASIRLANSASGDALQKVLAGPFHSSAEADDARIILSGNGISTIPAK